MIDGILTGCVVVVTVCITTCIALVTVSFMGALLH